MAERWAKAVAEALLPSKDLWAQMTWIMQKIAESVGKLDTTKTEQKRIVLEVTFWIRETLAVLKAWKNSGSRISAFTETIDKLQSDLAQAMGDDVEAIPAAGLEEVLNALEVLNKGAEIVAEDSAELETELNKQLKEGKDLLARIWRPGPTESK